MEFYSATKKNEILSFAGKWMELENIILSEGNWQNEDTAYRMRETFASYSSDSINIKNIQKSQKN
jgi:hypothetical protein